jgi:hypothetical protein
MENKQIASTIQQSGIARLYDSKSYKAKYNAQANLEGRTHWASDENLRFFGCRISSAHETASGLLFYVIESSFLDFHKTKRGFRYAIFDIFGECVARLDVDQAFSTSDQARKAMREELASFDVAGHYRKALASIAKKADREANQAREALANITEGALA